MALYPTVLRVETLKSYRNISGSAAHNYRLAGDLDHVERSRTHLNKTLVGDTDVAGAVKAMERKYGKARKESPLAFEVICSAHKDFFADKSSGFIDRWAGTSLAFFQKRFGKESVVHAVLHLDEEAPHLHITVVPLAETVRRNRYGETRSLKINYSQCIGIPRGFYAPGTSADQKRTGILQTEYSAAVAEFGLIRGITRGDDNGRGHENVSPKAYRDQLANDLNRLAALQESFDVPPGFEKRLIVSENILREVVEKRISLRTKGLREENASLRSRVHALEQVVSSASESLGCPSPAQFPQYAADMRRWADGMPQGVKRLQVMASQGADARREEDARKQAEQDASRKLLEERARPRRTKGQRATPQERRAARAARREWTESQAEIDHQRREAAHRAKEQEVGTVTFLAAIAKFIKLNQSEVSHVRPGS